MNCMDDLTRKLQQMSNGAQRLQQKHSISFSEVFTDEFVRKYTEFKTMNDFFNSAGIHSTEEFEAYPDEKLNEFVSKHTQFNNFQSMFNEATTSYIGHQLGF